MAEIFLPALRWYVAVQLVSLAAMPLALRLFEGLPGRGYAFAKSLGILLVGFVLWFGYSYSLLRNEVGGAWLALLIVAGLSLGLGWQTLSRLRAHPVERPARAYVLAVELLYLLAFAAWVWVRANDPAINHTEQPMDLMFMNGIWASPTYPPHDPWLAGYAISYYYFGYWMMMTVARLAGQLPEVAYNVGQASWFGLLLTGAFGLGYNLIALVRSPRPTVRLSLLGGFLTATAVGLTGNLQVILEWLYAQGVPVEGVARLVQVRNFPDAARVTKLWYIDDGWWWWRTSRVLRDTDLLGNHVEVIDEFPIFSYVLGDNHPHVLAMPFAILAIALALSLFLRKTNHRPSNLPSRISNTQSPISQSPISQSPISNIQSLISHLPSPISNLQSLLLITIATGGLVFLNTWDFPPYWVLVSLAVLWQVRRQAGVPEGIRAGVLAGIVILAGTVAIYLPYFLTAQSQARGILPNLFNPTHLPQFLLMFGHLLLGVAALILLAWREHAPRPRVLVGALLLVWGLPALFLAATALLSLNTDAGRDVLQRMPLPPDASGYGPVILERWLARPYTFLLAGGMAGLVIAMLWSRLLQANSEEANPATTFVLLLAGLGLLLVYAPEFVYLRDNFGTRMNTVFKFYYQGWLLLAVAASYGAILSLHRWRASYAWAGISLSGLSLLLILGGLIYPVAGAYSKASHFQNPAPTLDGLAYVSPDERAAIEWVRRNTPPDAIVVEGKGASYRADFSRMSAATGRATLLGWDGHEAQWRGDAYGVMAQGRVEALDAIYRSPDPARLPDLLREWGIDYVYVGPSERSQYSISPPVEARLAQAMDLVFDQGDVRIYRAR